MRPSVTEMLQHAAFKEVCLGVAGTGRAPQRILTFVQGLQSHAVPAQPITAHLVWPAQSNLLIAAFLPAGQRGELPRGAGRPAAQHPGVCGSDTACSALSLA
jgi:hypothetical protein